MWWKKWAVNWWNNIIEFKTRRDTRQPPQFGRSKYHGLFGIKEMAENQIVKFTQKKETPWKSCLVSTSVQVVKWEKFRTMLSKKCWVKKRNKTNTFSFWIKYHSVRWYKPYKYRGDDTVNRWKLTRKILPKKQSKV